MLRPAHSPFAMIRSLADRTSGVARTIVLITGLTTVQVHASPQSVSGPEISVLIRSTIVALHQANVTGNYSVMRDLGDRQFMIEYTQAELADMFRAFRDNHIDLLAAVVLDASLDETPKLTTDGYLRLEGHFETTPQRIMFDLTFRYEDEAWRVDGINVGTSLQSVASITAKGPAAAIPTPTPRPAGR